MELYVSVMNVQYLRISIAAVMILAHSDIRMLFLLAAFIGNWQQHVENILMLFSLTTFDHRPIIFVKISCKCIGPQAPASS